MIVFQRRGDLPPWPCVWNLPFKVLGLMIPKAKTLSRRWLARWTDTFCELHSLHWAYKTVDFALPWLTMSTLADLLLKHASVETDRQTDRETDRETDRHAHCKLSHPY